MKPVVRRSIHSGVRVVAFGAAAAALVVGAPALTWSADLSPNHRARIPLTRTPVTAASLVCPGPELVGLAGSPDVRPIGSVIAAAPPLGPNPTTGAAVGIGKDSLPALKAGTVLRTDLAGSAQIGATGTEAAAPGLVAAQSWVADTDSFRGLVSVACGRPASDVWLVGGGAEPGRQERVVLANPGANEVVVDLEVHGARGLVDSQTGRGVVVPGRGRTEFLLDAIAPGEARPVVHVRATGGAVTAVLNDTWLDGTTRAGSASSGPVAPAARSQVVPMVRVPKPGEGTALLRVAAPGDQSAVVQVRALTAAGPRPLPGGVVNVAAGATADLDLKAFAGQDVAVEATADVPVIAAARTLVRKAGATGDQAWVTAAEAVTGLSGVTLPDREDLQSLIGLVSSGGAATVDVVIVRDDGSSRTSRVALRADSFGRYSLSGVQAVWVRAVTGPGVVRATTWSVSGPDLRAAAHLDGPAPGAGRRTDPADRPAALTPARGRRVSRAGRSPRAGRRGAPRPARRRPRG